MSEGMDEQTNTAHANGHRRGKGEGHAHWEEMVAAYAAGELEAGERDDFERHLADCPSCRAALADALRIRTLLRTLAVPASASAASGSLAGSVLARLAEVRREDGEDERPARPVSISDGVLYTESPQWRSAVVERRAHPALTWHSGVRSLERWRMGMEHDTGRSANSGVVETAEGSPDDDQPTHDLPDFPPVGRRAASRSGRVVATVAAVLLVAVLGSVLFANRPHGGASGPAAKGTATSAATVAGANNIYEGSLESISLVSATEGWAVGPTPLGDPNPSGNVLLHFHAGRWSRVSVPTRASLYGIAMVSATDGWAVGDSGVILQYTADGWSAVKSPTITNLYSISMVSANDGWAVGADQFGGNAVILHYADGAWTVASLPVSNSATMSLYAVQMISARDGWAVGQDRTLGGVILRYDGSGWVLDAHIPGGLLRGVSFDSPSDGWAVGSDSSPGAPLLMRYTDGRWQRVATPSDVSDSTLSNVWMTSADEGWAVGSANGGNIYDVNGTFTVTNVILLHFHHGRWTSVIPPSVPGAEQTTITSIAMVSPGEGWAVGQVIASRGARGVEIAPLLFHYFNGTWSLAN